MLNLHDVNSLNEAKARIWTDLPNLEQAINAPSVMYVNNQLLIVGHRYGPGSILDRRQSHCEDLQFLDLNSNTTGSYSNTIDCGSNINWRYTNYKYPGMYSRLG